MNTDWRIIELFGSIKRIAEEVEKKEADPSEGAEVIEGILDTIYEIL